MKNSFNLTIDKYILRSTDDYFVVAEIITLDQNLPIVQLYREEMGFSIKFLAKDKFLHNDEDKIVFANLFRILVDIINSFMLEDGVSMKFTKESIKDNPNLGYFLQMAGIFPFEENSDEGVDFQDPLSYNEDKDEYHYDDLDDDTYFFGRERDYRDEDNDEDSHYGYEDFED